MAGQAWKNSDQTNALSKAMRSLTEEQRELVRERLPQRANLSSRGKRDLAGWSIYMEPSVRTPYTVRLHKRDGEGVLVKVIPVMEKGVVAPIEGVE